MRLAMAQISTDTDPAENLTILEKAAEQAAAAGADLVVFPEATMCRFGVPLGPVAQPLDGPWASNVVEIAQRLGVTIIAGMFTPAADGRVINTLLIAGPDGTRTGYDKIHLYDAFGFAESRTVAPGTEPVVVDVAGVPVGVATCYDIRFPALFTELARRGASVIVVPSSWGAGPGKVAQWETLATARALDSASYVAAVGQAEPADPELAGGKAPTGVGHSQLTDPFGSVVAAYDNDVRVDVHDVDPALAEKARAALGVLANARDIPRADSASDQP